MAQRGQRGRRAGTAAPQSIPVGVMMPVNPPETETPGPDESPDPLDFDTLPIDALRKYRRRYGLAVPGVSTMYGSMLNSGVGKRTWSYRNLQRAPKEEIANAVKDHFLEETARESEAIVDFLYAVQNKDKVFKIQFS